MLYKSNTFTFRWEGHIDQQVPLLRTSSPCPSNNQPGSLEQVKTFTEDDMDVRDFSDRPPNDCRPPKPPRKPKVILQNLTPPPECPDYMAMNHTVMGIHKPPLLRSEVSSQKRRKFP